MEQIKETLEEAAEYYAHNYFEMHDTNNYKALRKGFQAGAKWQAEHGQKVGHSVQVERSYSEEDLLGAFEAGMMFINEDKGSFKEWFEQFKKK